MELYAEKEMDLEKEREGNRWRKRKREGENMKDIQTYISSAVIRTVVSAIFA